MESDPLRFLGFRVLFNSETDFEFISVSITDIGNIPTIDLVLLGDSNGQNLFEIMASLKASHPDLRIIVIGSGINEETILKALASGAQGYVDKSASGIEVVQAIRIVSQGSVWAPRHVLSMFVERARLFPLPSPPASGAAFTEREKQVLELLLGGRSNKEIGSPLGIRERTVKAHVAKMMQKVGVQNRIALSVHALAHSVVIATPK